MFYYGGGWINDTRASLFDFADDMADDGIAVFLPQYRVYGEHGVYPNVGLYDTVEGLKKIPEICYNFGIDSSNIVWAGGSAGAHLVLCSALLKPYYPGYSPKKMFFFNPVCCPDSLSEWVENECGATFTFEGMCPLHDIQHAGPQILIMQGTDDEIAPFSDSLEFAEKYTVLGGICEIIPYPGRKHAFFHKSKSVEDYISTLTISKKYILNEDYYRLEV